MSPALLRAVFLSARRRPTRRSGEPFRRREPDPPDTWAAWTLITAGVVNLGFAVWGWMERLGTLQEVMLPLFFGVGCLAAGLIILERSNGS